MPDEEEGFTVRDRRRFLSEEPAAAPPSEAPGNRDAAARVVSATPGAFPEPDEELADEDQLGDGSLPDVYTVLAMFLGELRNLAWLRMGLVANPVTGQIERDLAQAKTAIDTVAFLATQIEGIVPPEERLPLRALVSDLQINFIEQSKK